MTKQRSFFMVEIKGYKAVIKDVKAQFLAQA